VEEGAVTKMLFVEVTEDVPTGDYVCERIEVTDNAQGNNTDTFYRSIQFHVAEDDELPKLQDVPITK
jgi:hypothetical protein